MSKIDVGDTYVGESAYGSNEVARLVSDSNTRPALGFVRLYDSADTLYDPDAITGCRALYIGATGTITVVDKDDHTEVDVPVFGGGQICCEFKAVTSISAGCLIYAMK